MCPCQPGLKVFGGCYLCDFHSFPIEGMEPDPRLGEGGECRGEGWLSCENCYFSSITCNSSKWTGQDTSSPADWGHGDSTAMDKSKLRLLTNSQIQMTACAYEGERRQGPCDMGEIWRTLTGLKRPGANVYVYRLNIASRWWEEMGKDESKMSKKKEHPTDNSLYIVFNLACLAKLYFIGCVDRKSVV